MRPTRKVRRDAKRLFRLCLDDRGALDDARARRVIDRVGRVAARNRLPVLRQLRRLFQLDIARHSATVESAVPLSPVVRGALARGLEVTYGPGVTTAFEDRPALLGGMRVQVGSIVYDGSIRGALDALEARL